MHSSQKSALFCFSRGLFCVTQWGFLFDFIGRPCCVQHAQTWCIIISKTARWDCDYLLVANINRHPIPVYSFPARKPFQCRYCPYSASQKGNLKTHVLCVHRKPFDNSLYPDRRLRRSHTPQMPSRLPLSITGDNRAPERDQIGVTSLCGTWCYRINSTYRQLRFLF